MTLDELAVLYNTDKKNSWHAYTAIYESLFEDRRESVKHVLEIGIEQGASIKMWRDYFPNAIIHGVDLAPCNDCGERTINYIGDQSSKEDLESLVSEIGDKLDIIIDDGSHHIPYMLLSLEVLLPHLKDGGYYILEDVQDYKDFNKNLDGKYNYWTAVSCSKIADNSHLIIIRK